MIMQLEKLAEGILINISSYINSTCVGIGNTDLWRRFGLNPYKHPVLVLSSNRDNVQCRRTEEGRLNG